MRVSEYTSADREAYSEYVQAHPDANYCHDLAVKEAIETTYGKKSAYLLCRDDEGKVKGVAPAFWMDSLLFGRELVSIPFFDYGGILADDARAEKLLLDELKSMAADSGAKLELRMESPLESLPAPENHKVGMVLDFGDRDEASYWKGLDAKVRNQVRKAEKSGVSVVWGKEEHLEEFYRVFGVNMRDLGSPVHSRELFRNLLRNLPGAQIGLALWNGYPVGGMFRIQWGKTASVPWASTLRKYRNYCPNMALYWSALQNAFASGMREFDFGRSTRDAGTHQFKKQWGAEETRLFWYPFGRTGRLVPKVEERVSAVMEKAAELWRRLPARYANRLGPSIRGAISA